MSAKQNSVPALVTWPSLVALALAGFLLAIFGTYWDDAWHTDRGRDSFFIAPHMALYFGISMGGGALAAWALLASRQSGWRNALARPALSLALIGVALTFIAAPIDNAWHLAFGRDSVIWSPPHMLGIAGSLAIAAGLLLELAPAVARPTPRWQSVAAQVAGAAVVAVCVIPVLEYETDVPQFAPVLYLPVLVTGTAYSFGLIGRVIPGRFPVCRCVLLYSVLIAVVAGILLAADMPAPLLPLLLVPALAFDWSIARRLSLPTRALFITTGLFLAYVPYLNWIKSDVFLDLGDVLLGIPFAALGAALSLWLTGDRAAPPNRGGVLAVATSLLLLLPVAGAGAHDPGQGDELETVALLATVTADRVRLVASPNDSATCASLQPRRVSARRAGEIVRAPLERVDRCRFEGSVELPRRGRWFVYAEFGSRGQSVESWLPVHTGAESPIVDEVRSLYVVPETRDTGFKLLAGIFVYSLLAATSIVIPFLYRRQREV